MRFETLYRLSFNVMLFLATLALNIDVARDNPTAPLYPLAVAIAAAIAFVTVDRNPKLGLNREAANVLGLASILLSYAEYRYDESLLVLAMGHWLVYLQIIKMFLPKTVEDDWFLFLLALTQVIVGAFQPGDYVGAVILAWALTAMWTLGLFHLRREAGRVLATPASALPVFVPTAEGKTRERPKPEPGPLADGPSPRDHDPYPNLVNGPFLASVSGMAMLTLLLGGLIFLLMPRWDSDRARRFQNQSMTKHLTGFSDSVKLGQMGEILENDTVVMSIEMFDAQANRVTPELEGLWRGISLQRYEEGRWSRARASPVDFEARDIELSRPMRTIRQVIKLEQLDTDVLFAMRPVRWADGSDLVLNQNDGSLYRLDLRPDVAYIPRMNRNPGTYSYTVVSIPDAPTQPYEKYPPAEVIEDELLDVPTEMRARLTTLVDQVLQGVPADDLVARAEALERYLRDGEFLYSLRMGVTDPSIDPIEDFLFNRKEGHCEYFASALTLLLRTAGIPARMVNGFKGGDYNGLAGMLYVRQKHAHSWSEALIGRSGRSPIWKTLDATPARQRAEVLAQVGGIGSRMRPATDFLRYLWVFYVVGFDSARQDRIIYGPIRALFAEARNGFVIMAAVARRVFAWLLDFPSFASVFSVRGFLVAVLSLFLITGSVLAVRRVVRWLRSRRQGVRDDHDEQASAVAAYRRLVDLLGRIGLKRPAPETPREFARRAADSLSARGPDQAALPDRVVEAFYRVRFGDQPLAPDEVDRLETDLDALESSIDRP
jgi:transglutaminase-like putative cysteine protease